MSSYERFLEQYPDHALSDSARVRMSDVAFLDLAGDSGPDAYLDYLSRYPRSAHVAEVRSRVEPILYARCAEGRDTLACDKYLGLLDDALRRDDVQRFRQDIILMQALDRAEEDQTFDAYHEVVAAYPDQVELVEFDGGIGGYLDTRIDLEELCPEDRPTLEKLAAEQGVAMDDVEAFPGFWVGPPRDDGPKGAAGASQRKLRKDCYPIPQWTAADLGLYQTTTSRSGDTRSMEANFGASAGTVFTFIARRVNGKYRIVAAKVKDPSEGPP